MAIRSAVKFYIQLMVILSLVALISSSKTKEMEIKQITGIRAGCWRHKKDEKAKDRDDNIPGFELLFIG